MFLLEKKTVEHLIDVDVCSAIADIERYAARVTHQPALADYGTFFTYI